MRKGTTENVVTEGLTPGASGVCAMCFGPVAEHFDGERYVGCQREQREGGPRRKQDKLAHIPVIVTSADEDETTTEDTPARGRAAKRGAAKRTTRAEKRAARAARKEARTKERRTGESTGAGRGRVAGLYIAGTKDPGEMTESIEKVFKTVKSARKGIGLRGIAEKLDMKTGTVGWALQKLAKRRAVKYQAAA